MMRRIFIDPIIHEDGFTIFDVSALAFARREVIHQHAMFPLLKNSQGTGTIDKDPFENLGWQNTGSAEGR